MLSGVATDLDTGQSASFTLPKRLLHAIKKR